MHRQNMRPRMTEVHSHGPADMYTSTGDSHNKLQGVATRTSRSDNHRAYHSKICSTLC
jgi:hypothetical protein